ncbi:MAG: ABC transporter ATP-binding protein [Alphaproteobacteria bacterium]
MTEPLLETRGLSKQFGGLAAVNDVSVAFEAGRVHAVIGPNGAGKTTFLNLLSGEMRPTSGAVLFKGSAITGLTPDRIARLGIGRSFQRTNVFTELTCFENCWIAAQSRLPTSLRFFRPAGRRGDLAAAARDSLEQCGLIDRQDRIAAALSHGERRQLEIAMILATQPELLLFDEPLAGMGYRESQDVIALLRRIAESHTLVLIEHDMDAVFSIADRVTVLVNGTVLETGPVAAIQSSPAVQAAYLGAEEQP